MSTKVFKDNISFAYLNNLYNKYFGSVLPSYSSEETETVFNEKLTYQSYNSYYDGYKLIVNDKYLVPIIESGIVVFIGDIDNYGYTIIIEGIDGVDIWYANIENTSLKLYDYVKKGNYLGETKNNNLYLVFEKNQELLRRRRIYNSTYIVSASFSLIFCIFGVFTKISAIVLSLSTVKVDAEIVLITLRV